jgi:hypothetical protein
MPISAVDSERPPILVRILNPILMFLGGLLCSLMVLGTLLAWDQPRVTLEYEASSVSGDGGLTSMSSFEPGPAEAGVIAFVGVICLGLSLVLRRRQFSLRRVLLTVFIAAGVAALLQSGIGVGAPFGRVILSSPKQPLSAATVQSIRAQAESLIQSDARMRRAVQTFTCKLLPGECTLRCMTTLDPKTDTKEAEQILRELQKCIIETWSKALTTKN